MHSKLAEPQSRTNAPPQDWLVGGGEMGELIRSMDWTNTPLGPIGSWPHSLRTTVNLCLASNFPINIVWGPSHVQIYNDGYRVVVADKHPAAMGMDYAECWASAWPAIGGPFERAWDGETSFLENQRMFLQRNGYMEETFFTFSLSPIRDETGTVVGLFHPVTETTSQMLSERRTRALRDLAAQANEARTTEEALSQAARTLMEYQLDLPVVLLYALDDGGHQARLIGSNGIEPGTPAGRKLINLDDEDACWPLGKIARATSTVEMDDVQKPFHFLSCGPYPEPPKVALAWPIVPAGAEHPVGIIIVGVSPRLPLHEGYRSFCEQLANGITNVVANARAYEQERKRAAALAEIDRAKTEFFSNVSHEFRTPLTLMLGPLEDELAERESRLPPARRERLETAHRNSLRLLKLVNTLLDFSRIEAGRVQASYEPTDLSTHTADLASVFRSAVERAGLTLTVNCASLPDLVYIDREMWEKIVLNLLSNALKHTFEGGIIVGLGWCGTHVELTVADTGVGITEAELPRLFDRFHRVKGAKSRTHEGTGIGLALVQELAALHGGTVRVASQEGKGTAFTVTVKTGCVHLAPDRIAAGRVLALSATRASAFVEEALHWLPNAEAVPDLVPGSGKSEAVSSTVETADRGGVRRARIVWADDNADMRDYVRRLLADRYDVLAVPDGLAALTAIQSELPDLVLTDVMMPGLDGFGLLRELRAHARTRTVPVILLSARAGEESALEGLDAGADDYLAKPFSAQELLTRVRTHLELARIRRAWATELERANKELESFSYSVSHDLRAPLRAIDGFSQALLEDCQDKLGPQGAAHLQRVRAAATRMGQLIDGMLELARTTRSVMLREKVSLSSQAAEIVSRLQRAEPDRQVMVEIAPNLIVEGDQVLLHAMLENLLSNAWKFTSKRADARIELGTEAGNTQSVYFVRDNGAGFDMKYADRLFGAFQRLHDATDYPGTGVGLATVQRIIQRHGGQIRAESELGRGTTFYFSLGAADVPSASNAA
jgi:signal transduction histidine kinase